jgi:FkbM family methyltransferase
MRYYCTYFDRNYLVKAVAILDSLARHEKNPYRIIVVCLDEITRLLLNKLAMNNVECIPLHAIEQNDLPLSEAKKGRTLVEYYWTLTPTVILRILEMHPEIPMITYLDADLFFYSSPDPIYAEMGNHSVLIHEHRYSPSLKHLEGNGKYNVGLLCFRNNESGRSVLGWWRERCNEWCFFRYEDGKMGDQMYLDDWTTRFSGVAVLQNPGAGLAPWNHDQYAYGVDATGAATVNGSRLVFYHFHALTFASRSIIIPAKHVHYPMTHEVLRLCYLPYTRSLIESIAKIDAIMPDFSFGLEDKQALNDQQTFLAQRDIWEGIAAVGMPQTEAFTDGEWRVYGSPQLKRADTDARPSVPSIQELWSPERPVTNSDELLHQLQGRPITREIKVLYIVGAHLFQEEQLLSSVFPNLEKIYLFEAIPPVALQLRQLTINNPKVRVFDYAISDSNNQVDFHVTDNNGESSSLLSLGKHQEIFPWVHEAGVIRAEAHRLEDCISWHGLREPDMLFLDVQGAEYLILSTLSQRLRSKVKLIYTEVSTDEIYRKARMLEDVKRLLSPEFLFAGFAPIGQICPTHGNAVFIHRDHASLLAKDSLLAAPESGKNRTGRSAGGAGREMATDRKAADFTAKIDENAVQTETAAYRAYLDNLLSLSSRSDTNYKAIDYAITTIVSTYKSEAFIRECLQDIEDQTMAEKVEIIVIDAASPENERAIVEEFQRTYSNIRYVRTHERIMIYAAWNLAFYIASGKYVTPLSTNDRLLKDAHEKMSSFLDANPQVALVYGDTYLTDLPHQTVENFVPSSRYDGAFRWPDFSYVSLHLSPSVGPHPMWRRQVREQIGFFDDSYTAIGDQEFWLRMGRCLQLAHIKEFTGLQWLTSDSLSGKPLAFQEQFEIHARYQQQFERDRNVTFGPQIKEIMANRFADVITAFVEAGNNAAAFAFFDKYRGMFPKGGEFERFDALIAKARAKPNHPGA